MADMEIFCFACKEPANFIYGGYSLCRECFTWLGWGKIEPERDEYGGIKTVISLLCHLEEVAHAAPTV